MDARSPRVARLLLIVVVASLASGCTLWNKITGSGGGDPADYVSGKEYAKLVVEIDHPPGFAPTSLAIDTLRSTLREVTGKTSVEIKQEATVAADANKKYSDSELDSLHKQHQSQQTGGDTAVLHVLFVAGGHVEDSGSNRILGLASPGGSISILKGNIRASAQGGILGIGAPKEENIERSVLVHEFGHAAGLVNLGAPMRTNHEDGAHQGHSSNKASVMYWAVETSFGLQELVDGGSSIPFQFDANDKSDLAALRDR